MRHGRARTAILVAFPRTTVRAPFSHLRAIMPRVSSTRVARALCGSLARLRGSRANSTRDPISEAAHKPGLTQLTRGPNRLTASLVGPAILSERVARHSERMAGEGSARRGFGPSAPTRQPLSIKAPVLLGSLPLCCGLRAKSTRDRASATLQLLTEHTEHDR